MISKTASIPAAALYPLAASLQLCGATIISTIVTSHSATPNCHPCKDSNYLLSFYRLFGKNGSADDPNTEPIVFDMRGDGLPPSKVVCTKALIILPPSTNKHAKSF